MPRPAKANTAPKAAKEAAPRLDRAQAVAQLVSAATALLAEQGPGAIKARTVADAAGLSTIAVYHHLGGVPELIQAVVDRGFKDLGDVFLDAPADDDPVTSLFAMALEARRFAQANPHLYDLMFGLSARGSYRPAPATDRGRSAGFEDAYAHLVQGCRRLVASGRVRPDEDPELIAPQLWSAVHGVITLELGGHLSPFKDPVRQVFSPMMVNLVVGLGDDPKKATASHLAAIEASSRPDLDAS
ncbi:TetR/AcrR family transcriptional regulator [Mycolicibacterium mucogenicum]|jgi:AcrR family transcriptional regulator|uniref:TetR/AcrR family transcriptional regulator n=1 Tax=Mycolicibacterium mucogenicum TaxID=56689 RepID=UPI002269A41D|nr:TetR/AcrR family transcriptional regulator [Mycolicibacterium mucogenicum]MCX8562855.1 TetR/AcrR family transcriptional regulator [Mycolicibacterium mucogenicum]